MGESEKPQDESDKPDDGTSKIITDEETKFPFALHLGKEDDSQFKVGYHIRVYAKDTIAFKSICKITGGKAANVFHYLLQLGTEKLNILLDGVNSEDFKKQQEIDFILGKRTKHNHRGYLGSNFLKQLLHIIYTDYLTKKPYSMNIIRSNIADYEKIYARLKPGEQQDQEYSYKIILSFKAADGIEEYLKTHWLLDANGKPSGKFREEISYAGKK